MRRKSRKVQPKARINKNQFIQAETLRVVSEEGGLIGVISKAEALKIAQEEGKDLVEISPNANPPVAKIIEFGKFKYQQERKDRAAKKTAHTTEVKQVRISLKIGQHDLDTKLKKMKSFLEEGHQVRVSMMLKGRENAHKDLGFLRLEEISGKIEEWADIDQPAKLNGRNISIIFKHKDGRKVITNKPSEEKSEVESPTK